MILIVQNFLLSCTRLIILHLTCTYKFKNRFKKQIFIAQNHGNTPSEAHLFRI